MFMRSIFTGLTAALLAMLLMGPAHAEAENPYSKSYVQKNSPTVRLQPDPNGPRLYRGESKEEDYRRMLREGYELIGQSSFQAADVSPEQALEQARKIKADLVLVYSKLSGSVPLSIKIEQLREKAMSSEMQDGEAAVEVVKPDDQNRYTYFASYWVKLAPPIIGVHVQAPSEGIQGLPVVAVIRQSPAEQAGIREGDVLTRIGDVTLDVPDKLGLAADRYAGKAVEVTVQRDGQSAITSMTLNARK
jgi:C-terminal processing protease CtpA/Prc